MRRFIVSFLTVLLSTMTGQAQQLSIPQIWYGILTPPGWGEMFTDDAAQWAQASKVIKVLPFSHQWVRNTPVDQLIPVFEFAKQNHIGIDMTAEAVAKFQTEQCGGGEGYTYPGEVAISVQKLASLGVNLEWVDMDEPLWFGSYSTSPVDCQLSIQTLIDRTVLIMKDVLAVYPNVKIMEVEPLPALTTSPTWKQDETAFLLGVSQQLGKPIHILQVDVQWNDPAWMQAVRDMQGYLQERNMEFGMIIDGSDQSATDTDWINSAINNIEAVEGRLHIVPAQVSFESWNPHPSQNLPETSPTSMTWLVDRYVRPRSELQVQFVGQGAHGKLTTIAGKPIPNAIVNGYKPGVAFSQPMPITTIQGVVPAGATSAIIAVRVNAECGLGCNGLNDLLLGLITYQETQGGTSHAAFSIPNTPLIAANGAIFGAEIVGGLTVTRMIAAPGEILVMNLPFFPVTAGANFQLSIPASTVGGRGWFGAVGPIWFGNNGEVSRNLVVPPSGKALVSTAVTAMDGTFTLFPMPRAVDGPNPVTIEFDGGGGAYRSTVWTPPP